MQKKTINIVWLKRDLRTQDHGPLFYAEKAGLPYIILYLFEPNLYKHLDTSLRHLQFQYRSILSINQTLNTYQKSVVVCHGNADDVFAYWINQYDIHNYSRIRLSILNKRVATLEEVQKDLNNIDIHFSQLYIFIINPSLHRKNYASQCSANVFNSFINRSSTCPNPSQTGGMGQRKNLISHSFFGEDSTLIRLC